MVDWLRATAACGCVLLCGCGGSGRSELTPADFAGEPGASGSTRPATVYSIEVPDVPTAMLLGATDTAAAAAPGPPMAQPDEGDDSEPAPAVLMDAKVGDVNGRPIIASVFLEDLMPRLRASLQTSPDRMTWRREAIGIISEKLALLIRDEVLFREAQSQLPEAVQQVGLRFFLSRTREQIRLQNSGSVSRADQLVRQQYGKSLDEYLQDQQRQALIIQMMNEREDFAPVTWTDIRNEYARRYNEFNPSPRVFARMILPTDDEQVASVRSRLEAGEAFAEVARDRSVNRYRPSSGGMIVDDGSLIEGSLTEMALVGFPELNDALVVLEPGAWAGPIGYSEGRLGFVSVDRIDQPEQRTLMDVQLELRGEIEYRRRSEAQERFFRQLIEDAGFGEERQMEISFELLQIAETRLLASGL